MGKNQQQNRPGPLDRLGAIFTGAKPTPEVPEPAAAPDVEQPPASPPAVVPPPETTAAEKERAYMLDRTNQDKARAAGQVPRVDPLPSAAQSLEARKPPVPPVGKRCPNKICQSTKSKVLQTRTEKDGKIRRERSCDRCGHSWWTEEK